MTKYSLNIKLPDSLYSIHFPKSVLLLTIILLLLIALPYPSPKPTSAAGEALTISAPVTFSGTYGITAARFSDKANANFYFEPSGTSVFNNGGFSGNVTMPGTGIWNSSGNVGIGTASPGYKLDVSGTGRFTGTVTAPTFSGALTGHASLDVAKTGDAMSGNIGRTAHAAGFQTGSYNSVGANDAKSNPIYTIGSSYNPTDTTLGNMYGIGYSHSNFWGAGKSTGWGLYTSEAGVIHNTISESGIWTSGSMRVASGDNSYTYYGPNSSWGGQLYVGASPGRATTNTSSVVATDGNLHLDSGTNKDMYLNYYASGRPIHVYGAMNSNSTISAASDVRNKTNIQTLPENTLKKVLNLRGVSFNWNAEYIKKYPGISKTSQIGVIAQEVEKLFPEVVITEPDGYKSVVYDRLGPILIEAVKEQQNEIDSLKSKVDNLEKEIKEIGLLLKK